MKEACIDKKKLGGFLRAIRRGAQYENTESFAAALEDKAGYITSKDTIYRIESGRQEPTVSYLCAVSVATSGRIVSSAIIDAIRSSSCNSWRERERAALEKETLERMKSLVEQGHGGLFIDGNGDIRDAGGVIYF